MDRAYVLPKKISYYYNERFELAKKNHLLQVTLDTACSGSLVAVHHAARALKNGDCSVAVAAGSNLLLGPSVYSFLILNHAQ
jgi:hybrid polyketide synthase/nonribosomal peptide synthetase ACE1